MPLLQTIEPENATGQLAKLYAQVTSFLGQVDEGPKLFGVSTEVLREQLEFMGYYMQHKTLSMPLLASIRLMVSEKKECHYCIDFNSSILMNMLGWSREEITEMKKDCSNANLPEKDKKMLMTVMQGLNDPKAINNISIEELKQLGWSDADIMDAFYHGSRMLSVTAIFNIFDIESDMV